MQNFIIAATKLGTSQERYPYTNSKGMTPSQMPADVPVRAPGTFVAGENGDHRKRNDTRTVKPAANASVRTWRALSPP